jgi:hypothetical protein
LGFSGGGAEMVEMSIRTRDPKKSTRVPTEERRLGGGSRVRIRRVHSLPVPSFPAEIAEDGRRPVRVGLRGVVRATAPGASHRPDGHIVVVPDVADAGSHLSVVSSVQNAVVSVPGGVLSRSEPLAANSHEFRRVSNGRGRARPLRSVREKRGRKSRFHRFLPLPSSLG